MPELKQQEEELDSDLVIQEKIPWEKYSDLLLELQEQRIKINNIF